MQTKSLNNKCCPVFRRGSWRGGGGGLIPFPRKLFFQIPAQIPQSQPVLLKLKSHSHFSIVFFHESQSQWTKSHFPASKKGKSQFPFCPFTTLFVSCKQYIVWDKRSLHSAKLKTLGVCTSNDGCYEREDYSQTNSHQPPWGHRKVAWPLQASNGCNMILVFFEGES